MPIAPPTPDLPWTRRSADAGRWRRALVYGLGLSGTAATEFLANEGVEVVAFDRRGAEDLDPDFVTLASEEGVRLELGGEPDDLPSDLDWNEVDGVVVSPGVPLDRSLLAAARLHGVPVIGEVELAEPFARGVLVGITGSNGKSTTTALTAEIFEAAGWDVHLCGNIGRPMIRTVLESPRNGADRMEEAERRVFVIELSSFQLESMEFFRPRAGALLNLSADHLDRHADLESYREAKLRLFRNQRSVAETAVLNADDPRVVEVVPRLAARCRFFSRTRRVGNGCFVDGGSAWESRPAENGGSPGTVDEPLRLFDLDDVPVPGPHNVENALAAALLARSVGDGVAPEAIVAGLRSFRGLPHRVEKVRELAGVVFYDDSKGTNPGATRQSVAGFGEARPNVRLVLGGRFKGGDLGPLVEAARQRVAKAYLIGESAELFSDALGTGASDGGGVPHEIVHTLDRAVERAAAEAREGDVVLLSPACSSFDQFTNFVERGRVFQRRVQALEASDVGSEKGGADGS